MPIFMKSNLNWFVGKRDGSRHLSNINLNGFPPISLTRSLFSSISIALPNNKIFIFHCFRNALYNKD